MTEMPKARLFDVQTKNKVLTIEKVCWNLDRLAQLRWIREQIGADTTLTTIGNVCKQIDEELEGGK